MKPSFAEQSSPTPNLEAILSCGQKPEYQRIRSQELKKAFEADQADYRKEIDEHPERPLDLDKLAAMASADLERRKLVGEIVAEGCLQSSADYAHAAMIYQHGNVPDHFYLALGWAKRSVDLGDSSQKHLVAMAADRYLVKSGRKQLFGTQFDKPGSEACLCIEPIERRMPESERRKWQKNSLADQLRWLKQQNKGKSCGAETCPSKLAPSERGSLPGIW